MIHVQNSTLAGGVAVGAMADMMIQPWGAMLVGTVAGIISVLGYEYMTLWFAQHYGFHDTCGVNNLHGKDLIPHSTHLGLQLEWSLRLVI